MTQLRNNRPRRSRRSPRRRRSRSRSPRRRRSRSRSRSRSPRQRSAPAAELCVICMDAPQGEARLRPCCHTAFCAPCAIALANSGLARTWRSRDIIPECPLCRTGIQAAEVGDAPYDTPQDLNNCIPIQDPARVPRVRVRRRSRLLYPDAPPRLVNAGMKGSGSLISKQHTDSRGAAATTIQKFRPRGRRASRSSRSNLRGGMTPLERELGRRRERRLAPEEAEEARFRQLTGVRSRDLFDDVAHENNRVGNLVEKLQLRFRGANELVRHEKRIIYEYIRGSQDCEWRASLSDDGYNNFYLYGGGTLLKPLKVYGAIGFIHYDDRDGRIGLGLGYDHVFYVTAACATFERIKADWPLSNGRLLWTHALQRMADMANGQTFLVVLHSISDARIFWDRMGLKPYTEIEVINNMIPNVLAARLGHVLGWPQEVVLEYLRDYIHNYGKPLLLFYMGTGDQNLELIMNRIEREFNNEQSSLIYRLKWL